MRRNGGFTKDEQRHLRNIAAVGTAGLDALVCFSSPDVLLATGYWPVMSTSVAILSHDGAVYVLVPEDETDLAQETTSVEIISYKPETLHRLTNPAEALEEPFRELSSRLPMGSGRIGISLGDTMQTASYQACNHFRDSIPGLLRTAWPGASVVSADDLLRQLKSVKTPHEIEKMRHACVLAGGGFREAERAIAVGRREDQVAAEVNAAYARVALDGFHRGSGFFFCMSGPNSTKAAGAYARTRQRVIEESDQVMIHTNTVGDGLWTDITRTHSAGEETKEHARWRVAILEARAAALAAIKPGIPAKNVDKAARDVLTRHGFGTEFKHAVGHGVGYAAADANALPRLHPESPDMLEAGSTFNIEPAIYKEGSGGMRHCDVVVCTDKGAEVLTQY